MAAEVWLQEVHDGGAEVNITHLAAWVQDCLVVHDGRLERNALGLDGLVLKRRRFASFHDLTGGRQVVQLPSSVVASKTLAQVMAMGDLEAARDFHASAMTDARSGMWTRGDGERWEYEVGIEALSALPCRSFFFRLLF